jgi:hypothetical protein
VQIKHQLRRVAAAERATHTGELLRVLLNWVRHWRQMGTVIRLPYSPPEEQVRSAAKPYSPNRSARPGQARMWWPQLDKPGKAGLRAARGTLELWAPPRFRGLRQDAEGLASLERHHAPARATATATTSAATSLRCRR